MATFSTDLWQQVQMHIDNNYTPSCEGDGINWMQAKHDAHEALSAHYDKDNIEAALSAYGMPKNIGN